jgi:hypothetical protein
MLARAQEVEALLWAIPPVSRAPFRLKYSAMDSSLSPFMSVARHTDSET